MNWFIYVGGWMLGNVLVNTIPLSDDKQRGNINTAYKLVMWTSTWIWICWKFIK
jgi:hypothetical protein